MKNVSKKGNYFRSGLGLCIAVTAFGLTMACANPINPGKNATGNASHMGSLSVQFPAFAPWLQPGGSTEKSIDGARALAVTTSVKIEVTDSSGAAMITPVTFSSYAYGPGTNTTTQTIDMIPVGTNFTVKASVYNSHVSSTDPVVTGQTSGVNFSDGVTTPVNIHCTPVSPSALVVDGAAVSASLSLYGEQWYSTTVTSGTAYYISQANASCVVGIYNGSGTYISSNSSYLVYNATYSGNLYLVVVNTGSSSATSASLAVSTTAPVLNEGTVASPVGLTLNTAHTFKTGPSSSQNISYYSFTTTTAGAYALTTASGYYAINLYSDAGFTTLVSSSSYVNYGTTFTGLSAATNYYLKLTNGNSSSMSLSGQIVDPVTIGANTDFEGSIASPIALTVDTSRAGKAGALAYSDNSYYSFTTGTGVDYNLSLTSITPSLSGAVYAYLYSNSSFTTQIGYTYTYSSTGTSLDVLLAPSTTYYVKVANSPANLVIAYSLKASTIVTTFTALPADGTWTPGALSGSVKWYEATVSGGQSYLFNWANNYEEGTGDTYTLYASISAYNADRTVAYFSGANSGYSSGNTRTIAVPAGQTKIYIKVAGSSNNGTFALKLAPRPASGSIAVTID